MSTGKRLGALGFVVCAIAWSAVVLLPSSIARADHITGSGLNCWVAIAGVDDGLDASNETAAVVIKCSASSPMPTGLATTISSGCSVSQAWTLGLHRSTGYTGASTGAQDWCGPDSSAFDTHGIGFAYGDLVHTGGTVTGNTPGYPANTFAVTISFTFCPPGCGPGTEKYVGIDAVSPPSAGSYGADWSVYAEDHPSDDDRLYMAGLQSEPCGGDSDCTEFYEGWPHVFVGMPDWPAPECEGFGVDWNPDDETQLPVGDRQRVTLTAPTAQWDDVTLEYSWTWGYDPLNGWGETVEPAVYLTPSVESQTATTITLASAPVTTARSNLEFHVRCNPDDPLQDDVFYRRAYGDLSTSDGPSRRACYFLRFTIDGPMSPNWDTEREARLWVDEDGRYDAAGGILDLAYSWRPTDGVRTDHAWTYDGDDPPWAESPAEVDASIDVSGFTGPTSGTQFVKCTDSSGDVWLRAGYAPALSPGDTGGSGDGIVEGGTGGVGGEGLGEPTGPGGGDPNPGDVGGVGPGAIGDGPGNGASCFDDPGWSLLNPASWVLGGIKVGACYARALILPDPDVLQTKFDGFQEALYEQFPFSMVAGAADFLDTLGGEMETAAGTGCWAGSASWSFGDYGTVAADDVCVGDNVEVNSTQRQRVLVLMLAPMVWALLRYTWAVLFGGSRQEAATA